MTAKRRIIVQIAISIFTVFAAVLALGAIAGVRINIASNSLPPGFYRIVPPGSGSDLLICPTGIAESVSIGRGYRPRGAAVVMDTRRCSNPSRHDTATPSPYPVPASPSMAGCSLTQSNTRKTHLADLCLKYRQERTQSCQGPFG